MPGKSSGIIQVYTGGGKGKTTAAAGQALRAAGSGQKTAFFQFFKSGAVKSGEEKVLRRMKNIDYVKFEQKAPFFEKNIDLTALKKRVAADMKTVERTLRSGGYDLVVLDEAVYVMVFKFMSVKDFIAVLKKRKDKTEVVITGRDAPKKLCEAADLVTEMREVKHPFEKGVKMKKGREY